MTLDEVTPPGWMLHSRVLAQFEPSHTLKLFPKWLWPIGANKPAGSRGSVDAITHVMLENQFERLERARSTHWVWVTSQHRFLLTSRVLKHTRGVTCCDLPSVSGDSRSAGYTRSAGGSRRSCGSAEATGRFDSAGTSCTSYPKLVNLLMNHLPATSRNVPMNAQTRL